MKIEQVYRLVVHAAVLPSRSMVQLDELFLDRYKALDWAWILDSELVQIFGSKECVETIKYDCERGWKKCARA